MDTSGMEDEGGTDELLIYVQLLLYNSAALFNKSIVFYSVTVSRKEGMSFLGSKSNSDGQVHPMYS